MSLAEPIAVTLDVVAVLDELGIPYLVGGSLASSVHGVPRSTNDLNLVVELPGRLVDELVARLRERFYIDRDMIVDALKRRASFNIVHLATMFKVDLFTSDRSELVQEEMRRRELVELGEPPKRVWVCSAEDIVIQKLDWFRKGDRVSERQWNDLIGVLKVQRERLDLAYIRRWASTLGLSELAEEAIAEVGL
jgi:hypothetical protein